MHCDDSACAPRVVPQVGASVSSAFRSSTAYQDPAKLISHHEAQLLRLSANFAFASDLALLLGGRLKFEELLMGRLSDAMGAIFLGYATLHHFQRNHASVKGLEALAEASLLQLEYEARRPPHTAHCHAVHLPSEHC